MSETPESVILLDAPAEYERRPTRMRAAKVLKGTYTCRSANQVRPVAVAGEYVVNPGSEDEYPITEEKLRELYRAVAGDERAP